MDKEQPKRTPQQIIGDDALTQLIFEGYEVMPARRSSDEQAEVVGWLMDNGNLTTDEHIADIWCKDFGLTKQPLYASPPAVATGGVTEKMVERAMSAYWGASPGSRRTARDRMVDALLAALAVGDEGIREGRDHG